MKTFTKSDTKILINNQKLDKIRRQQKHFWHKARAKQMNTAYQTFLTKDGALRFSTGQRRSKLRRQGSLESIVCNFYNICWITNQDIMIYVSKADFNLS